MGCPSSETIQDLIDGRLSRAVHDELLAHADECAGCRALVVDLIRRVASSPLADTLTASDRAAGEGQLRLHRGASVGRFIVIGELGAGAMGVVVSAYDPQLDRKVAIKVVRPGLGESAAFRGHATSQLRHVAACIHAPRLDRFADAVSSFATSTKRRSAGELCARLG